MTISGLTTLLHAGTSQELTFLVYLYRVVLHVGTVGGIALLAYWVIGG